jgi:hypothetical protein
LQIVFGAFSSTQTDCPVQMQGSPHATHCRSWQVCWPLQLAHGPPPGPPQEPKPSPGWHVPFAAQQPSGHVCGPQIAQRWPRQSAPEGQAKQNSPPVPHAWRLVPGRQAPGLPVPLAAGGCGVAVAVIDGPIGHDGPAKERVVENRRLRADVGTGEIGVEQTGLPPGRTREVGAAEGGALQTGFGEDDAARIRPVEGRLAAVDAAQDGAGEALACERAPGVIALRAGAARFGRRALFGATAGGARFGLPSAVRPVMPLLLALAPLAVPAAMLGPRVLVALAVLVPVAVAVFVLAAALPPFPGAGIGDRAAQRRAE